MFNPHEIERVYGKEMAGRGFTYDPWQELFVKGGQADRGPLSQPSMANSSLSAALTPTGTAPDSATVGDIYRAYSLLELPPEISTKRLRPWQATFVNQWFSSSDSFALQADPGQGKTFAALLAASGVLARGGRVVYVAHTREQFLQVKGAAAELFGEQFVKDHVAVLSGQGGPKRRERFYADVERKLIIITAASLARDIKVEADKKDQARFNIESIGLLILDEADLMRGREPLAIIHQAWKGLTVRPRLLAQSATFTVVHNPPESHPQVRELKRKLDVDVFHHVREPDTLNFDLSQPTRIRLSRKECIAAAQIRAEFWRAIDHVEELFGATDELRKKRSKEPNYQDEEQYSKLRQSHTLPPIELLNKLIRAVKSQQRTGSSIKANRALLNTVLKSSFLALELYHLNELLVNQPRVCFLEYGGQLIHGVHTKALNLPHVAELFPPGSLPPWWEAIARGTPYESLPTEKASGQFFCTDRELGEAAKSLTQLYQHGKFRDHGATERVIKYINGQWVKSNPHQVLAYCGSALEAMYLCEVAKLKCSNTGVTLLGHSHTESKQRDSNFSSAANGVARHISATSVVDRGVHIGELGHLLMLGIPSDLAQFKQLCGRVGRTAGVFGTIGFIVTEGSSREAQLNAIIRRAKEYGPTSPLRKLIETRLDIIAIKKMNGGRKQGLLFE